MTTTTKRGRGRPAQPADQRRSIHLDVRVSPAELARYTDAADAAGQTLSDFIRGAADHAASSVER